MLQGNWKASLSQFRIADSLDAPANRREYLARALMVAAVSTSDDELKINLCREAVIQSRASASNPGQIWQWALSYPPGFLSDALFASVKAASRCGQVDAQMKKQLAQYLDWRSGADPQLPAVVEARRLETSVTIP